MICEKSSDSGDLTSHPNTQFHASLTRAIIASLRAALYHANRITSRNRAAGIRMSGLQHGDNSAGSNKRAREPRSSETRSESADRVDPRHVDVLYASIDFLNYLMLKLLVVAVVGLLHIAA